MAPPDARHQDYAASLLQPGSSLQGLRFGLLNGFFNHTPSSETTPVNDVMAAVVSKLTSAGATVINITDALYDTPSIAKLDVQPFEFRQLLDTYLSTTTSLNLTFTTLFSKNNTKTLIIPAQHPLINLSSTLSPSSLTYPLSLAAIQSLTLSLHTTFASHNLTALIYPHQKSLPVKLGSPSQHGRNGILAALTGYPAVCVPAGFSLPSKNAPKGVPVGVEILGRPWSEGTLVRIASLVDRELGGVRRMPPFAEGVVERKGYGRDVPVVRPGMVAVPGEYPLGGVL